MGEMTENFVEEMEQYLADRDYNDVTEQYLQFKLAKMLKEDADPAEMAAICLLMYQRKNDEIEKLAKYLYSQNVKCQQWDETSEFVRDTWRRNAKDMLAEVAKYEEFKESCR